MSLTQKLAQLNCTALRFIDAERSETVMGLGDYTPGGKLPMSAARSTGQLPVYYAHQRGSGYEGRAFWPWPAPTGYTDGTDRPLYPFGHGRMR